MDDFYIKEQCDVSPMLRTPVLFVLFGERGKEVFPFLRRTQESLDNALQILQVAEAEHKILDPLVEYVGTGNDPTFGKMVQQAMANSLIPRLKSSAYTMQGTICVNVVVDLKAEIPQYFEQILQVICKILEIHFENSVDLYFYCVSSAKFDTKRPDINHLKLIEKIENLRGLQEDWVKLVYILSDLNEVDVYSTNNIQKKYLALVLNTYLQAGYHTKPGEDVFDGYVFASSHAGTDDFLFQALGCAPLELDTDMMEAYFKKEIIGMLENESVDDEDVLKNIFSAYGEEENIVKETFESTFPYYLESAEFIAYNKEVLRNAGEDGSNRVWLKRVFNDNEQEFFDRNISAKFYERFRVVIENNHRECERKFTNALVCGKLNPFQLPHFQERIDALDKIIKEKEKTKAEQMKTLREWESKNRKAPSSFFLLDRRMNKFRRKLIQKWFKLKQRQLILDGEIRYLTMERDSIENMTNRAKSYSESASGYLMKCENTYSRINNKAFDHQKVNFESHYSVKIKEAMDNRITVQERLDIFSDFCKYMIDPKSKEIDFMNSLESFVYNKLWKKAEIQTQLVEELWDRMGAASQNNKDDVLVQLYQSIIESMNVDLRIVSAEQKSSVCCIMGPSDNEFISFLHRYKQRDARIYVAAVEQLRIPVALYFKFNISPNEIRI